MRVQLGNHYCYALLHKLDNLYIIIDYNKIQSLDFVKNVLRIEPLTKKISPFNCNVKSINGHNTINPSIIEHKSNNSQILSLQIQLRAKA